MRTFKIMALLTTMLLYATMAFAQTVQKHTVKRGETLTSIAKQYGISKDEIVRLNPDAAQFVYVGMELNIPIKKQKPIECKETKPKNSIPDRKEIYQPIKTKPNKMDVNEFCHYGFSYRAAFESAGHGYYALGGTIYYPSGWGVDMNIGANYGLIESDYAGVLFLIGPAYGYAFENNVLLYFVGTYFGQGPNEDLKFNWGLSLTPKVGFKINKVMPFAGLDIQWSEPTKDITIGFIIGIGFDL